MTVQRVFGQQAQDLEHDFAAKDRPALVTALLAGCDPQQDWWDAPVGRRIAALLDLMQRSTARSALVVRLRCESADCGKRFEIVLPASPWDEQVNEQLPVAVSSETGEALMTLRRPTGADLRACREQALAVDMHPAEVAEALLKRLCLVGTPCAEDAPRAAEALAEADPLVAFHVFCACPECGHEADRAVDLEAHALDVLALRQRGLLDEVHRLATHYGWSEREIFEVSPARRRLYLQAIAGSSEEPFGS